MSSAFWTVTLAAALGQAPMGYGGGYANNPSSGAVAGSPMGYAGGTATGGQYGGGYANDPSAGAVAGSPVGYVGGTATGGQYGVEQLYPYDAYENWMHGHFQEIPAYGGFHFYRPYNYKHVLSQSQVAAGWGMSPTMPYSHEYFRRVQGQAAFEHRLSQRRAVEWQREQARLNPQRELRPVAAEAAAAIPEAPAYPIAGNTAPAARAIAPASYAQPSAAQTAEIHERLRQLNAQMQALQQALPPEAGHGPGGVAPR